MSSDNQETTSSSGKRIFWRSLEHKADPARAEAAACGSDVVKRNVTRDELFSINRRKFLSLTGAMGTLAGIEGCIRRPTENILPYSDMPEQVNPGVPSHYATVTTTDGDPLGLVVTSYEGRPTKVEGNPDHPVSRGATDVWAQSSILDLYDPERSRQPLKDGVASSFEEFDKVFAEQVSGHLQRGGAGLFILAQSSASPSYVRVRELVQKRMPRATFVTYAPVSAANARLGAAIAFGQSLVPLYSFEKAKVVLALDSDFLGSDPGSVSASRGFARGRDVTTAATAQMNRLYVVEPNLSVTGGSADHRLRLAGGDIGRYTRALAAELAAGGVELGQLSAAVRGSASDGIPAEWIKTVAKELIGNRGRSLIVAGYRQPPAVHALVAALNRGLGNLGQTVEFVAPLDTSETDPFAAITFLAREMGEGNVKTLLTFGGNPVYDAPPETQFAANYKKVPFRAHFSSYVDETGAVASWQVPRAQELESWGDAQTASGYYSVQQPLIAALWGGRSDIEVLAQIAGVPNWRGYDVVQATLQERGIQGELAWRKLLHKGVAEQRFAAPEASLGLKDVEIAAALKQFPDPPAIPQDSFEAVFVPDPKVYDGRYVNNVWLLELPDPITRITWDNAALLSPSTAKQLGIENGDMIRLTRAEATIDIVAWRQPGVAARSVILPLGWGRTRAGSNGNKRGFDVYPLRSLDSPHFAAQVSDLGHAGARLDGGQADRPGRHARRVPGAAELRRVQLARPALRPALENPGLHAGQPVGHGDRPQHLLGLQRVRDRVSGREQHTGRRQGGGRARPRDGLAADRSLLRRRRRRSRGRVPGRHLPAL
jgi:hypothetical protein